MSEVYEHNPSDHEDPVAGSTWLVGICGALLLVAIIYGLTALMYRAEQEVFVQSVLDTPIVQVRELREEQQRLLEGPPRTVSIAEGVEAHIVPIEEAMQDVVNDAQRANNQSRPSDSTGAGRLGRP